MTRLLLTVARAVVARMMSFPTDEDVRVALAEHSRIYREHDTGRTGPTPEMAMRAALQAVKEQFLDQMARL